jgi:hypothetical protein
MFVLMQLEKAKKLVEDVLDLADRLNASVVEVSTLFSETDVKPYRLYAGRAIGYMFSDVLRPIFRLYPQLEPEPFKREGRSEPTTGLSRNMARRLASLIDQVDQLVLAVEREPAPNDEQVLWKEAATEIRDATAGLRTFVKSKSPE